jgi:hypothetical protein
MATYIVELDDYAGWNPTGRNFALIAAAIGAVGLISWLCLHGHLGAFRPAAVSDQLFLEWLVWLGIGGDCLMAFAASGSILLSLKSRGSVSVTAEGIVRTIDSRNSSLSWDEIEGFVPMPHGGVRIIAASGKADIFVPRFLDDYRACIAEIKDHGIRAISHDRLTKSTKKIWFESVRIFFVAYAINLTLNSHLSHRFRIAAFGSMMASAAWVLKSSWTKPQTVPRWVEFLFLLGIGIYVLRRLTLSW